MEHQVVYIEEVDDYKTGEEQSKGAEVEDQLADVEYCSTFVGLGFFSDRPDALAQKNCSDELQQADEHFCQRVAPVYHSEQQGSVIDCAQ